MAEGHSSLSRKRPFDSFFPITFWALSAYAARLAFEQLLSKHEARVSTLGSDGAPGSTSGAVDGNWRDNQLASYSGDDDVDN